MYWNWIINLVESNWNCIISTFHQDHRFFSSDEKECGNVVTDRNLIPNGFMLGKKEYVKAARWRSTIPESSPSVLRKAADSHCSRPSWVGASRQGWEPQAAGCCVGMKDKACYCCRKGDPFQGPEVGSGLTLGNELLEETHVLRKQAILVEKGIRAESHRVRGPRRTALSHGLKSRVLWWWH